MYCIKSCLAIPTTKPTYKMNKVSERKKILLQQLLMKVLEYRVVPVLYFPIVRLNTSSGEKKCINIKLKGTTINFPSIFREIRLVTSYFYITNNKCPVCDFVKLFINTYSHSHVLDSFRHSYKYILLCCQKGFGQITYSEKIGRNTFKKNCKHFLPGKKLENLGQAKKI